MIAFSVVNTVYAQETVESTLPSALTGFLETFYSAIFNPLVLLLMTIATVVFLWGVIEFISKGDNDEAVTKGKRHMVYGIIGLFIMVSVWGIMQLICTTVGAC